MTTGILVACPSCQGSGGQSAESIIGDPVFIRCGTCKGEGRTAVVEPEPKAPEQVGRKESVDPHTKRPKDPWHLVPWEAMREVVRVLEFGARKYAPGNWAHVKDWREQYYRAAIGHLVEWHLGETKDKESSLHPLAHAGCCVVFCLALDLVALREGKSGS